MTEPVDGTLGPLAGRVDGDRLSDWLREQRWFASKLQTLVDVELIEEGALGEALSLAVAQVEFASGGHGLYQLVLALHGDEIELDALTDPPYGRSLLHAIDAGREVAGVHGRFCFRHVGESETEPGDLTVADLAAASTESVRPVGTEQSNSSIVFGDRLVLKLFRKLEPGINPELEMLRFLTAHEYPNIAALHGWIEYEGDALAATLGVVQRFMPGASDGWRLALEEIPTDPEAFLSRLAGLGTITARLHGVLATDAGDPAFSPEEPSSESLSLLAATLDEQVERLFRELPDDDSRVAPIVGLEQEVRERISLSPQAVVGGRSIRIHGDYHLGQILHDDQGWTLIDFEGEPSRPLAERRAKRSPLRDVASMLRSFSYATWAVQLQRGLAAPADFEERARDAFLGAYLSEIPPALLPSGPAQVDNLLRIFELEKALYEVRYELDNRPDWVAIPVTGILRIVGAR